MCVAPGLRRRPATSRRSSLYRTAPPDRIKIGSLVTIRMSDAAEAVSSPILAALAQVIRALAPEVSGVSFHDPAGDALWSSADLLPPEDHQLMQEALSGNAGGSFA